MTIKSVQLRHAVHLARIGNFHRAAEDLQISQAGLSRSISALEAYLGAKLFDRLASGTAPTRIGEALVERATRIVTDLDDLEREIGLMRGLDSGQLVVGGGPFPMALAVMPALARLLADKPNLKIRAKQHDWHTATDAVIHQQVDFAIAELSYAKEFDGLATRLIGQHLLYFFSRPDHPLQSKADLSLADLQAYPMVGTPIPERVAPHFGGNSTGTYRPTQRAAMRPSLEVDDLLQAADIAARSDVLFPSPLSLVAGGLERGGLKVVPLVLPWFRLSYGLITVHGRSLSPAALALLDIIDRVERELREREADLTRIWIPPETPSADAPQS